MTRTAASALVTALLLCGCQGGAQRQVDQAYDLVQLDDAGKMMAYDLLRAEEDLDPKEREYILAFQVMRLKGPGWRYAHDTLVALGKDSIPILIMALDRDDPTEAELRPRYGFRPTPRRRVFNLSEVAYTVLSDIVVHYSNYTGAIPARDRAQWERWWGSHESGLIVSGRRRAAGAQ